MLNLEVFLRFEALDLTKPELATAFSIARQLKPHSDRAKVVMEGVDFLLQEPESVPRRGHPPLKRALPPEPEVHAKNRIKKKYVTPEGVKRPLESWRYDKSAGRPGYVWIPAREMKSGLPRLNGRMVSLPGYWMKSKKGVSLKNGKVPQVKTRSLGRHYADPKQLGEAITNAMTAQGMGTEELAILLNVTESSVHNWRAGRMLPRPEKFEVLTKTLGLRVEGSV